MTTAKDLRLDHYTFYDVPNQQAGHVVGLQGQFDKHPDKVRITYLNLFGNPADKNGEGIYDKHAHLTWYDLYDPTPDPMRKVAVENQFGETTLVTGRSTALLVPAQKADRASGYRGEFPEKLDHYKVYQILDADPPSLNRQANVSDQFGSFEARIYSPIFFAVPVKKWADGKTFGIHNEKAHLLLYRVYPWSTQRMIYTRDQFGSHYHQVFRGVLFGVPTSKQGWKEID